MNGYLLYEKEGESESPAITLATGSSVTGVRELLVDLWNARRDNGDPSVTIVDVGDKTEDQREGMLSYARNKTADILNLDVIYVAEFAKKGLISRLDPLDPEFFLDSPINTCLWQDNAYAIPFNSDVGILFGRQGVTPPNLTSLLTEQSTKWIAQLPASVGGRGSEVFICNLFEHALAVCPEVISNDGVLNGDYALWNEALSPLRQAFANRVVISSSDVAESVTFFENGQADVIRDWPVGYHDIRSEVASVTPLTRGVLGGQNLAIVEGSPNWDAAKKVIDFLTGREAQHVLSLCGFAPVRRGMEGPTDPDPKLVPYRSLFRTAIEGAVPRPSGAGYVAFSKLFCELGCDFLFTNKDFTADSMDELRNTLVG